MRGTFVHNSLHTTLKQLCYFIQMKKSIHKSSTHFASIQRKHKHISPQKAGLKTSEKKNLDPMQHLVLFNKPFNVLCQFTDDSNRPTLKDYIGIRDIYAAGRLDFDSEGLLLLTNNGALAHKITSPKHKTVKTYWAQVEGIPSHQAINALCKGVLLKDGLSAPANVSIMQAPEIWPRQPPIRERKNIPTTWLRISISEGRNRQVRRMTANIGHPTLRLIRYSIGDWTIDNIKNGEYLRVTKDS